MIHLSCLFETMRGDGRVYPSPCTTIRLISLLSCLEELGLITWNTYNINSLNNSPSDIVVLNRFPFVNEKEIDQFIMWRKSNPHTPIVYDIDDNLVDEPRQDHPEYYHLMQKRYQVTLLLDIATDIIVSSFKMKDLLKMHSNANIHMLSNRFVKEKLKSISKQELGQGMHVLFMGTSGHQKSLEVLEPLFNPASEYYTGFALDVIGFNAHNGWFRSLPLTSASPNDLICALGKLQGYACGIAPLFGDPGFEMYKTDIKAFDYLYAGLATVASNKPPYSNSKLVQNSGILVSDDLSDWHFNIKRFADSSFVLRKSESALFHAHRLHGSLEETAKDFYSILSNALQSHGT